MIEFLTKLVLATSVSEKKNSYVNAIYENSKRYKVSCIKIGVAWLVVTRIRLLFKRHCTKQIPAKGANMISRHGIKITSVSFPL